MEETYSKVSDDAALDSQKATARGVRDVRATLAVDEGVGSFFLRPEGRKVSKSTTHTPHTHAFRHQRHHNSSPPPAHTNTYAVYQLNHSCLRPLEMATASCQFPHPYH
jgi:hypothetical protein